MSISLAKMGGMSGALSRAAAASADRSHWAGVWLTRVQCATVLLMFAIAVVVGTIWPVEASIAFVAAASLLYSVHFAFRAVVWFAGLKPAPDFELRRRDAELPIYSIIVPLRHEANMADKIVAALLKLDYPSDRLDVQFAVDHDDEKTAAALVATDLPPWMRVVVVPQSALPTKPRACNHALPSARGEFVVLFDAEDRPEPHQLRQAVATFDAYGVAVSCLQARLVPHNADVSLTSRMFALDYCQWFDATLTGLQRLGYPIPLGGTSNHFRTSVLVESGAWDPYNVTEDADLGYRLARLGHGVRTLNATTFEEAPTTPKNWLNQRTRWLKGYIQTLFVHLRSGDCCGLPPLGVSGTMGLVLFLGATVLFALVNPIFWLLLAFSLFGPPSALDWLFPDSIRPLAQTSFVVGNGIAIFLALCAPLRRRWWRLIPWALLTPLYWIMISMAAYRAAFEFVVNPFRWRKTPHGVESGPNAWSRMALSFATFLCGCVAMVERADSGAWAQPEGTGFALDQFGLSIAEDGQDRKLIEGYGEFGLGNEWTFVFAYDGDVLKTESRYVWRAGAGIRRSTVLDFAPGWVFSAEASGRYQAHGGLVEDPVFAGDGWGVSGRVDAGTNFRLFDQDAFGNLSIGYVFRPQAPDEVKLEAVSGLSFGESWQAGAGYFGSIASGPFYEPGAYTKHEVQAWIRWRMDAEYAVQLSVAQSVITRRVPSEATFRVAIWSFVTPTANDED